MLINLLRPDELVRGGTYYTIERDEGDFFEKVHIYYYDDEQGNITICNPVFTSKAEAESYAQALNKKAEEFALTVNPDLEADGESPWEEHYSVVTCEVSKYL
jgi:hypothetical protein